jgi:hypothetical protein
MERIAMDLGSGKRVYTKPSLTVYGDLRRLTAGATGPQQDGGAGSTKSKATGTA